MGGEIKVWDLDGPECLASLLGHNGSISGISMDWGRGLVASASWDGTLRCWDQAEGRCIKSWREGTTAMTCLAVDWQAGSFLCGCSRSITLWDPHCKDMLQRFRGHE